MIPEASHIIGTIVARNIANEMQTDDPGLYLIKNFSEEISKVIAQKLIDDETNALTIIASVKQKSEKINWKLDAPHKLLAKHEKLTKYRNETTKYPSGLILIAVGPIEDGESLKQVPTFTDRKLLLETNEKFPERMQELVKEIWNQITDKPFPSSLSDEAQQIYGSFREGKPSLSEWVIYLLDVCSKIGASRQSNTSKQQVREALCSSLTLLSMFPDQQLFMSIDKRVWRNQNIAAKLNPSGRELVTASSNMDAGDRLLQIIENGKEKLLDIDGSTLSPNNKEEVTRKMRNWVQAVDPFHDEAFTEFVDLHYWEQVFKEDAKKLGLGDEIKLFLSEEYPERLPELTEGIIDGLNNPKNKKEYHQSATELVDTVPLTNELSLFQILEQSIRRKVEKILNFSQSTQDPLAHILQFAIDFQNELEEIGDSRDQEFNVKLEHSIPRDKLTTGQFTCRLFALLYGQTFDWVSENIAAPKVTFSLSDDFFEVDETGSRLHGPFDYLDDDSSNDEIPDNLWDSITLNILVNGEQKEQFTWSPADLSLCSIGRLMYSNVKGGEIVVNSLEDLEDYSQESKTPLPTPAELSTFALLEEVISHRGETFEKFKESGISSEDIYDHVKFYLLCLEKLTDKGDQITAENKSDFLSIATSVSEDKKSSAVLPTHPIKLRWFGEHLAFLKKQIKRAFEGELHINKQNPDLYHKWIAESRPHQQPPAITIRSGERHIANREVGFGDEYKQLTPVGEKLKWSGGIGKRGSDLIAKGISRYLKEHPQKQDGLSLLILSPSGEKSFTRNIVESAMKTIDREVPLVVHVLASSNDHAYISEDLEILDAGRDDTNLERSETFMPRRQVQIYDEKIFFDETDKVQELVGEVDIAITADMFSVDLKLNEQTQSQNPNRSYNPLFDNPVHHPLDEKKVQAHVSLLPYEKDELLQNWSTLVVEASRGGRVDEGSPENTDFWKAVIALSQQGKRFTELHSYAHWVITVDRFINRSHIDAINLEKPKNVDSKHFAIIDVKEKVGENRLYTQIISSSSGRDFIEKRFAAKLLSEDLQLIENEDDAKAAAKFLYEAGCEAVPSKLLQALGQANNLKEIIGSVMARSMVEKNFPIPASESVIEIHLSLDDGIDHLIPKSTRADFLRILIFPEEKNIEFLICEAKYGDNVKLKKAVQQVQTTEKLIKSAFTDEESDHIPSDKLFWVRELSNAVQQLPYNSSHRFALIKHHGEKKISANQLRKLILGMADDDPTLQRTKVEGAVFVTQPTDTEKETFEEFAVPVYVANAKKIAEILGIGELSGNSEEQLRGVTVTPGDRNPIYGKEWTEKEISIAVEIYLMMWEKQQSGESVESKKEALALVRVQTGRTKGSVERKMCNLSFGMKELGFDFVDGWKPLPHASKLESPILFKQLQAEGHLPETQKYEPAEEEAKVRVYELARELDITNKEVVGICEDLGLDAKSHSSSLLESQANQVRKKFKSTSLDESPSNQGSDEETLAKDTPVSLKKGMTQEELQMSYQILLNLLDENAEIPKMEMDEPPYKEGPAFYRMRVELAEGSTVSDVTRNTDELKVRLRLEQGKEIRSFIDKGHIVFEVPKLDTQRYWIDAHELWAKSDWEHGDLFAPIGEDIEGNPIGINFSDSATAHLLIAGSTGSGKSVALETILYGLCQKNDRNSLRLHLIDPKGVELVRLEDDPKTKSFVEGQVGYDAQDAINVLSNLVDEMERRYRSLFRAVRASSLQEYNKKVSPSDAQPWHVVVLDEYNDLVNEKEDKETIKKHLVRLAQKGRAAGIHVIVATQRPDATVIDGVIRTNLPAALALATSRAIDSRVILDENGAEALCAPGEALFSSGGGKLERIQVAQVKDES
tara:strand:+ start:8518 stop:14085 length:5568 start_codon:yes stop_codon:yes gene_type:complete